MSDDLISRKAFIEYMNKNFEQTPQIVAFRGIIAEQPTAFDKEKVIKQVRRVPHGYYNVETENEIIDIIEKGGIE